MAMDLLITIPTRLRKLRSSTGLAEQRFSRESLRHLRFDRPAHHRGECVFLRSVSDRCRGFARIFLYTLPVCVWPCRFGQPEQRILFSSHFCSLCPPHSLPSLPLLSHTSLLPSPH